MPVMKRKSAAPVRGAKRPRVYPSKVPRSLPMTLTLKKQFYLENWQPSAVAVNSYWKYYAFSLSQMPDIAQYVSLFDTFRINGIRVDFRPRYDNFAGNDTSDTAAPGVTNLQGSRMSLISDPKSRQIPVGVYNSSTYNDFLQQGDAKHYEGNRPFSLYFKPEVGESAGANVAGAIRRKSPWLQLETANDVQHAGFHAFAWDQNFSGQFGNSFDVLVTYYVQFKGMR